MLNSSIVAIIRFFPPLKPKWLKCMCVILERLCADNMRMEVEKRPDQQQHQQGIFENDERKANKTKQCSQQTTFELSGCVAGKCVHDVSSGDDDNNNKTKQPTIITTTTTKTPSLSPYQNKNRERTEQPNRFASSYIRSFQEHSLAGTN